MDKEEINVAKHILNRISRLKNAVACVCSYSCRIEKELIGMEWKTEEKVYADCDDLLHKILEELTELDDELNDGAIPRYKEIYDAIKIKKGGEKTK